MPSRVVDNPPSDDPANGMSPSTSTETNDTIDSAVDGAPPAGINGNVSLGKPWNRVESLLQKEFAREKKAGKLSFERKVELYGEKLEEKFRELEERLLCREEELLLKGRELQRMSSPLYTHSYNSLGRQFLARGYGL